MSADRRGPMLSACAAKGERSREPRMILGPHGADVTTTPPWRPPPRPPVSSRRPSSPRGGRCAIKPAPARWGAATHDEPPDGPRDMACPHDPEPARSTEQQRVGRASMYLQRSVVAVEQKK